MGVRCGLFLPLAAHEGEARLSRAWGGALGRSLLGPSASHSVAGRSHASWGADNAAGGMRRGDGAAVDLRQLRRFLAGGATKHDNLAGDITGGGFRARDMTVGRVPETHGKEGGLSPRTGRGMRPCLAELHCPALIAQYEAVARQGDGGGPVVLCGYLGELLPAPSCPSSGGSTEWSACEGVEELPLGEELAGVWT